MGSRAKLRAEIASSEKAAPAQHGGADQLWSFIGGSQAKPLLWRLGVSAGITAAALALSTVLFGVGGAHLSFLTLFPAVALAAVVGGCEGGTMALAGLTAALALGLPMPSQSHVEWAGIAAFLVSGAVVIAMAQALRSAQRKLLAGAAASQAAQDIITGSKKAQIALHDANLRLEAIVATAVDAIVVTGESGIIQSVNPAAARIFGYALDEMVGKNVNMLMPEEHAKAHDGYLETYNKSGERRIIGIGREMEGRRKDGSIFPIDLAVGEWAGVGGKRFFTGIIRDITRRKQIERQLAQAKTMEAVGQLAGGLAHDINNILAVISGNLELTGNGVTDAASREAIQRAQEAVDMGTSLNRRLLTFARQRKTQPVKFDVNAHVRQVTSMLGQTLSERVAVSTQLAPDLWPTLADPHEVENAILNLAINARDAMPEGGKFHVATRNVTLDAAAVGHMEARGGDFVCITVSDTGIGMPPEVRERAIEPFFTTKEPGKGTGLGLSSVYGFIKQAGGHLSLESETGKGTKVHLYLPRAPSHETKEPEVKPG